MSIAFADDDDKKDDDDDKPNWLGVAFVVLVFAALFKYVNADFTNDYPLYDSQKSSEKRFSYSLGLMDPDMNHLGYENDDEIVWSPNIQLKYTW